MGQREAEVGKRGRWEAEMLKAQSGKHRAERMGQREAEVGTRRSWEGSYSKIL